MRFLRFIIKHGGGRTLVSLVYIMLDLTLPIYPADTVCSVILHHIILCCVLAQCALCIMLCNCLPSISPAFSSISVYTVLII